MPIQVPNPPGETLDVPLAPTPRDVPAGRPRPAHELINKLAELAQRIPAQAPDDATGS
jgi:hypothetical protein